MDNQISNEAFKKLIQVGLSAIGEIDLADYLGVSRTTIERWGRGVNLPQQVMRDGIALAIHQMIFE